MQSFRSATGSFVLLITLLCGGSLARLKAAGGPQDSAVRQTIEDAVRLDHPSDLNEPVNLRHREDLESALSKISSRTAGKVSFYDLEPPESAAAEDASTWAVVPGEPGRLSYGLYSFDNSEAFGRLSLEFSKLMSGLGVSIVGEQMPQLARFFLGCCVRGAQSEIVGDEDELHHAIERYYLSAYGDVWRALEVYSQWWRGYQEAQADAARRGSSPREEAGSHISLRRLVLAPGMHPQVQQWQLDVARDGSVRVVSVEGVFPKQPRWLSYDYRSTLTPFLP